jgi:hypothetical protein
MNINWKIFRLSSLFLLTIVTVNSQSIDSLLINDGPYIFIEQDGLIEKSIVDGEVVLKKTHLDSYKTSFTPENSTYKNVKKIVALSDIHGQYNLALEILKNNKIINKELKWNFGKGHLVIVGDVFDRGDKVTEVLWFLYNLEHQAEKKGGKVHYLLGNHEYMVLHSDLRYIHDKYAKTSELLDTSYDQLFNNETVLGRWLRSKATMVKINDSFFVHGGISQKFLDLGFEIKNVNQLMRESIDRTKKEMKSTSFYKNYYSSNGPIWYRGYFNDNLKDEAIVKILSQLHIKYMVVGHCSNEEVVQLYDNKVFGVDSSIKNGKYGEVLFMKTKRNSRGTMKGKRILFKNQK